MKKILKFFIGFIAVIILLLSIVSFLYGSMKLAQAERLYDNIKIDIPGIIIENRPQREKETAQIIISVSTVTFIFGIIGIAGVSLIKTSSPVIEEKLEENPPEPSPVIEEKLEENS